MFNGGIDDSALLIAQLIAEYKEEPLTEDLFNSGKLAIYIGIGSGLWFLFWAAIIDLIYGKGTFRMN